jgi:hypothetical protein
VHWRAQWKVSATAWENEKIGREESAFVILLIESLFITPPFIPTFLDHHNLKPSLQPHRYSKLDPPSSQSLQELPLSFHQKRLNNSL